MNWYQVKARLERVADNGAIKAGSEVFLVKANSFATAERVAMEEVVQYATGGVDVVAMARKNYKEVFASNEADADKWFKCKLSFLTIDEKSGKEKKTAHLFLVKRCQHSQHTRRWMPLCPHRYLTMSLSRWKRLRLLMS